MFGEIGTYQQFGDLLKRQGQGEEALKQYVLGRDLAEKTAKDQPESDKAQANLAVMLMRLGDMELELNGDAQWGARLLREGPRPAAGRRRPPAKQGLHAAGRRDSAVAL